MTSYMRDNFERFGNYISIDVIHSSICNAKDFCYITSVIKNEIGKIYVVCDSFFRNLMMLIHLFWFIDQNMPSSRKNQVYTIFSDEFMTKSILDLIYMNDNFIFYDHFHLKMNLEKALLSKWIVLKPLKKK